MRKGLSLKYVIGGGASLVIGTSLVIYIQIVLAYSGYGLDYITGLLMEEEALYFAARYQKNPNTPLPHSAAFSGVIDKNSLPENVRQVMHSPPSRRIGAMQVFDGEFPESTRLQLQPLYDGKTLFLYENQSAEVPDSEKRLSDEYIEKKLVDLLIISLFVPSMALLLIMVLVWLVVRPLRRLAQWSMTLANPAADIVQRPSFNYRELNILAESLLHSVQRVKAASLREERLLRYTSHELRTPLTVLKANLQLLECSAEGQLSPPLMRMKRSVLNMQGITETLLWMSREQQTNLTTSPLNMRRLLEELLEENQYLINSRPITVVINTHDGLYPLPANATRIVIGNLLRNALQYTDEGLIEITCTPSQLCIENHTGDQIIRADSADFGYGLGLELLQNLCERLGWKIQYRNANQSFTVLVKFLSETATPCSSFPD